MLYQKIKVTRTPKEKKYTVDIPLDSDNSFTLESFRNLIIEKVGTDKYPFSIDSWGNEYGSDAEAQISVYVTRLETEEEFNKRVQSEEKYNFLCDEFKNLGAEAFYMKYPERLKNKKK